MKKIKIVNVPDYFKKGTRFNLILGDILFFLYALVRGINYNHFYINTTVIYPVAIAGFILKKNIIYHVHEKFIQRGFRVKICEYCLEHIKSQKIFVSNYIKNQFSKCNTNSVIQYNFLSEEFISSVEFVPIMQRKLKNIILISSLYRGKGIYNYIELAKLLPEFHFSVVISSNQNMIDEFLKDIIIPFNMSIYPAQSNLHSFLKLSDLILNLSIPSLCIETFGMTILEAMPYGIPAIVPNVGGITELVKDAYNGFCVDVTDLASIKNKILYILDKNNYSFFAENAVKIEKEIFRKKLIIGNCAEIN
jgi:glycosyltransferase involved in cell wall biosynthesis